jgi:hypothetical protein
VISIIRPKIPGAQDGFVKGRCTVTSLMQFSNFVIGEMEEGWQVDAEYTDFSKAFEGLIMGGCRLGPLFLLQITTKCLVFLNLQIFWVTLWLRLS